MSNKNSEELDDIDNGLISQTKIRVNGQADSDGELNLEFEEDKLFLYDVHEGPPWYLTILFALQQCFLSLSRSLSTALLVADIVCARKDETLKAKLLSTTFFMSGLCTFLQNTIGIRLPLYQGPAMTYVIPLLAMSTLKEWQCTDEDVKEMLMTTSNATNSTTGIPTQLSELEHDPLVLYKLQQFTGSLMIAGIIHMLIGMTGIVGFLVRFIGPVTVVPALTAVSLYSFRATVKFAQTQWGVAYLTAGTTIVLSLYLRKLSTPIPVWTYSKGFRIKRFPLHKVFSVLIGAILGWVISVILTEAGAFSDDNTSKQFYARTDSRTYVIDMASWFIFPYPGQFGAPSFSTGAFITFLFGTITSVLDSIGDYYACAKICSLPSPPAHSINRGIAVEGFSSFLAGSAGAGHATSTFGGNIGAIGITKVASLRVFQVLGLLYMIFGVIGKIGAVCVTIPYSVVGGMQMINFGVLCGVMISNIQYTDMKSTRNHVIIGCSLFIGLMMPYWMRTDPDALNTGIKELNNLIKMFLANPAVLTGFLACFLDNTVPGTNEERGLTAWNEESEREGQNVKKNERDIKASKTYNIDFLPKILTNSNIARYIPICPSFRMKNKKQKR